MSEYDKPVGLSRDGSGTPGECGASPEGEPGPGADRMAPDAPTPPDPLRVVADVLAALEAGRAPRARLPLQVALRELQQSGRVADELLALRTLAHVDLRRGRADVALRAARAALRLARASAGDLDVEQTLQLLALSLREAGRLNEACRIAREWLERARRRHEPIGEIEALRFLALAAWDARDWDDAFFHADDGLEAASRAEVPILVAQAERLLAGLLARAGCLYTAAQRLTPVLRTLQDPHQEFLTRLERGWALMGIGEPDTAARDFRRARRIAGDWEDPRPGILAAAGLALADAVRDGGKRGTAARAALARLERRAIRYHDARLASIVGTIAGALDASAVAPVESVKEAAARLVTLAQTSTSLLVTDACVIEVAWLAKCASPAAPYNAALYVPPPLE